MIGSLLTRGLTLILGYIYPAYECFKCMEQNRPDFDSLRFWCEYWIIMSIMTVLERVGGDAVISWLPLYGEAKLAFIVYLWYPKTKGTTYVYATFVRPFVAQYENDIDGNLGELRTRAGEFLAGYWQRGSTYFPSRFVELLQFLASQSQSAGRVNYPIPPANNNAYPPRLQSLQTAATSGSYQASAPASAPGYAGPPPSYPTPPLGYPAPPPGYPDLDLSGYRPVPPSGTYPAPPPGYPPVLSRSAGSNDLRPTTQPHAAGYPGAPRSRPLGSEEDDEFELVDRNANFPDEPAGPGVYGTRPRQRASGAGRGRGDRGTGPSNLYPGGGNKKS